MVAMRWLIGGTQPGDSLFFHYSGHGSQVVDHSGDEEDGLDETICPVDFKSAGQIIDDEVNYKYILYIEYSINRSGVHSYHHFHMECI
jgi:hypothetical protein